MLVESEVLAMRIGFYFQQRNAECEHSLCLQTVSRRPQTAINSNQIDSQLSASGVVCIALRATWLHASKTLLAYVSQQSGPISGLYPTIKMQCNFSEEFITHDVISVKTSAIGLSR